MPTVKVILLGGMQEPGARRRIDPGRPAQRPGPARRCTDDRWPAPGRRRGGLRWVSPIGTQTRQAAADTELGGVAIPRGVAVGALVSSANRDEAKFDDPDRFDIFRPRRINIAFGAGRHFCAGHAFSRAQMRIAIEMLLRGFRGGASTRPGRPSSAAGSSARRGGSTSCLAAEPLRHRRPRRVTLRPPRSGRRGGCSPILWPAAATSSRPDHEQPERVARGPRWSALHLVERAEDRAAGDQGADDRRDEHRYSLLGLAKGAHRADAHQQVDDHKREAAEGGAPGEQREVVQHRGSANRPVQNWFTSSVDHGSADHEHGGASGEPCRLETIASGAGIRGRGPSRRSRGWPTPRSRSRPPACRTARQARAAGRSRCRRSRPRFGRAEGEQRRAGGRGDVLRL